MNVIAFSVSINIPIRTQASDLSVWAGTWGCSWQGGVAPLLLLHFQLGKGGWRALGTQHSPVVLGRQEGAVPDGQAPSSPITAGVL